jgi:hypothetical protein
MTIIDSKPPTRYLFFFNEITGFLIDVYHLTSALLYEVTMALIHVQQWQYLIDIDIRAQYLAVTILSFPEIDSLHYTACTSIASYRFSGMKAIVPS